MKLFELKKHILTDLNSEYWKNVDIESVSKCIDKVNSRILESGQTFGESKKPESFDINIRNVSHFIKNVVLEDNIIYGDVTFLKDYSMVLESIYNIDTSKITFELRGLYITRDDKMIICEIFTWDIKSLYDKSMETKTA